MFDEIIPFFKIGKNLGIKEDQINGVFHDYIHKTSFRILLILISIVSYFILIFFLISNGISAADSTYPSGTRYSTIKIKDFKNKSRLNKLVSPLYSRFLKVLNISAKF